MKQEEGVQTLVANCSFRVSTCERDQCLLKSERSHETTEKQKHQVLTNTETKTRRREEESQLTEREREEQEHVYIYIRIYIRSTGHRDRRSRRQSEGYRRTNERREKKTRKDE